MRVLTILMTKHIVLTVINTCLILVFINNTQPMYILFAVGHRG